MLKLCLASTFVIFLSMNNFANANDLQKVRLEIIQADWPITLMASVDIPSSPQKVWALLTDYDHLTEVSPQMETSRVLQRTEEKIVIEQTTETRFLFFWKKINVKLNVLEKPFDEIAFYQTGGNMELFSGKWVLQPMEEGSVTRLIYRLKFKPDFYVPRWIVLRALEREVPEQLLLISERAADLTPK
ncbi:MAG: SRPBCC family protein [Nitrospirae bacterium]|nr:SRPBCC family protein [Nitrospirota bacterium]MBI3351183.1 SRPBCC family protein [Nitrospirota bacterium]